jgi:MFS family permease
LNDGIYWQAENAPGWFMFGIWMIYLICLVYYFEDPPKKKEALHKTTMSSLALNKDEIGHLLGNGTTTANHPASLKEPPIWCNVPVMVTFTLYFVLKLILEGVLSATAILTDYYFGWHSGLVGIYLAGLGLLVLPANACVALLAQSYDDREFIVGIQLFMFLGCISILQYTTVYPLWQYIIASIILFISTNALEGPNMSLLSKTIPPSWSKGIFNVGLLATEAGTLGRAIGDVLLTIFGSAGLEHLLNRTFGSLAVLSFGTLVISLRFYDFLEPSERDD